MIAGFHLIWTAYGCWLPNDPRGSSSHDLRVDKLASLGEVHLGRKPTQPPGREIRAFYQRAEEMLEHARILFTDEEIALVGHSLAKRFGNRVIPAMAAPLCPTMSMS